MIATPFRVRLEVRSYELDTQTTVRFLRELRLGHVVDVSCAFTWPGGRTGRVAQQLHRTDDGSLVAELHSVGGLLDLTERRLVREPGEVWRRLARHPELLGLAG